jgi:hypothetical protein
MRVQAGGLCLATVFLTASVAAPIQAAIATIAVVNARVWTGDATELPIFSSFLRRRKWGERKRAFEEWLRPENFDAEGKQKRSLATDPRR